MIKNQKGFTGLEVILLIALTAVIVGGGFYVYNQRSNSENQETNESVGKTEKKATSTKVNESTYSVILPAGWKKVMKSSNEYVYGFGEGNFYEDSNGNYFAVYVDAPGREFTADASWGLKVSDSSLRVASKEDCTEGPFCSVEDKEYRVGMTVPDVKLGDHEYFFLAGNNNDKSEYTAQYQQIVESIVAN